MHILNSTYKQLEDSYHYRTYTKEHIKEEKEKILSKIDEEQRLNDRLRQELNDIESAIDHIDMSIINDKETSTEK